MMNALEKFEVRSSSTKMMCCIRQRLLVVMPCPMHESTKVKFKGLLFNNFRNLRESFCKDMHQCSGQ